jgi:hypothetical protein
MNTGGDMAIVTIRLDALWHGIETISGPATIFFPSADYTHLTYQQVEDDEVERKGVVLPRSCDKREGDQA